MAAEPAVDAVLVLSFGGPEGPDEVMPFLENVLRGRPVPRERMEAVAAHYQRFGGVSPINGQNRALIDALQVELKGAGIDLPVYWGNRNWHPLIGDTVAQMRDDGVRYALVWVTSAYSSYSSCRQYQDDLARAAAAAGPEAPLLRKLRPYYNHPGFVEPLAEALRSARARAGTAAPVLFSAHSIPLSMASTSDYVQQLTETARLVAECSGQPDWQVVYQSRSGAPGQPWLEPDVVDVIQGLPAETSSVVVAPIGFVSDHMEVVYDLDVNAAGAGRARGINVVRAATPGTHPRFVAMIRELIEEQIDPTAPVLALGGQGPAPFPCDAGCCPAPVRPTRPG